MSVSKTHRLYSMRYVQRWLVLLCVSSSCMLARADEPSRPPTAAINATAPGAAEDRLMVRRPDPADGGNSSGVMGGSWWPATAGVTIMLVVLGAAGLVVQRGKLLPGREPGQVRVVGRVQLTPRHAIHVVRAGERTLLVGTGAGGPPTLLGELPETPALATPTTSDPGAST